MNNKQYQDIKESVLYDSNILNVSISELCNDMVYCINLCNDFSVSFDTMIIITNRIELEKTLSATKQQSCDLKEGER